MRHAQPSLWDGLFAEEVGDLWEPWMREVDEVLNDERLQEAVYEAQGKRHPQSRRRGRHQTPAEVVLRMLLLKHVRNWSYETLEREVRSNLVYRSFCRIGMEKVPDAKTLVRLGQVLGPEVIAELHERIISLARQKRVVVGRKLRVDTTVVETNIHYPTDSTLLGDGARVLTRVMKKIAASTKSGLKQKIRDRMRSVRRRVLEVALAARQKSPEGKKRTEQAYRRLLSVTRKVVNQAQRVQEQIGDDSRLCPLEEHLAEITDRVKQVIRQTAARILRGKTRHPNKLVSVFEPQTEIIRKGKASRPTEFGKMVKIQEAENQIITHFEVFETRPNDSDLLVPAVEAHEAQFGHVPQLVAADGAFYSQDNERVVQQKGVKWVAVPNRNTRSPQRRQLQKKRWFKKAQRWRTGCEGRISVLKRRHGMNRSRYRSSEGMQRWVGLAVIADNLMSLGRVLATAPA